jgi:hypothetical protein
MRMDWNITVVGSDEIFELCRSYNAAFIANGHQTGGDNYFIKRRQEISGEEPTQEEKKTAVCGEVNTNI